jgi:hypothetical protein
MTNPTYLEQMISIREDRSKRLKDNPVGWFSLIGLFRLEEGDNPFGAGDDNKIVLTEFSLERCGAFRLENSKTTLIPFPGVELTINQMPAKKQQLHTDLDKEPDRIEMGSLTMMVIQRGEKFYLRVWDRDSKALKEFNGLNYFPIDPEYRLNARFVTYDPPREITILDVIGTEYEGHLYGEARFTLNGVDCALVAEEDGDELVFSFTDETRADLTYPGGRLLVTSKPENECVILDFNLAVNWPCAYTSFATCPLPPKANHLTVRIEAGEMRYTGHANH